MVFGAPTRRFRADLLSEHSKTVMTELALRIERKRTGAALRFKTQEDAVVHIQRWGMVQVVELVLF